MNRKMKALAATGLAVLALAGCERAVTTTSTTDPVGAYTEVVVQLSDGREVVCIGGSQGALSCDWARATQAQEAGR